MRGLATGIRRFYPMRRTNPSGARAAAGAGRAGLLEFRPSHGSKRRVPVRRPSRPRDGAAGLRRGRSKLARHRSVSGTFVDNLDEGGDGRVEVVVDDDVRELGLGF